MTCRYVPMPVRVPPAWRWIDGEHDPCPGRHDSRVSDRCRLESSLTGFGGPGSDPEHVTRYVGRPTSCLSSVQPACQDAAKVGRSASQGGSVSLLSSMTTRVRTGWLAGVVPRPPSGRRPIRCRPTTGTGARRTSAARTGHRCAVRATDEGTNTVEVTGRCMVRPGAWVRASG